MYDNNNIFAKIIRGEIPCDKLYEDDYCIAFKDISPKAPVHILVLPKGEYKNILDFASNASKEEQSAIYKAVEKITEQNKIADTGFRVITNCGLNGGQEVPHLHFHIVGGKSLGPMLAR